MNPLIKNFLLMTRTIPDKISSMIPIPVMLCSRKAGAGQPHMDTPIEKYINMSRKIRELISLFLNTGISLFSSLSSMLLKRFPSCFFPSISAPYPASLTALMTAFSSAVPVTLIEFVRSDTLQEVTPSTEDTAFSTCAWHAAQLIPVTL